MSGMSRAHQAVMTTIDGHECEDDMTLCGRRNDGKIIALKPKGFKATREGRGLEAGVGMKPCKRCVKAVSSGSTSHNPSGKLRLLKAPTKVRAKRYKSKPLTQESLNSGRG